MAESKKRKFTERRIGGDYASIGEQLGIHPLIARIIRNRDVKDLSEISQYISGKREDLHSPALLKDGKKAASILKEQIESNSHIRVIGDYDIDGVMSSYILVQGLKRLGANVSVQIPHRISDGYGLNMSLIEEAKNDGVDCIITCDNGISAIDEIAKAKEYGMTVIVTDHHQVLNGIPKADAVVNPHQSDCQYPFKNICGATVAWKVIMLVYEAFGLAQEEAFAFIENVALATVGDIMPLQGENRILVKEGLKAIQKTKNPGMAALIKQCNLEDSEIKAYHFGFVLGPCINATGRLDTATRALELFLTEDYALATKIAQELVELNTERKDLTSQGVDEAIRIYEEGDYENDPIVVLYLENVHESIAGIIAGRIRERYYKPTFILTNGEECIKGSARSIDEYSLAEEMAKHQDLFLKFGGHPKAAGLSLKKENIDAFRKVINESSPITVEDEVEIVTLDACPPLDCLTLDFVNQLSILEPFGNENPGPVFGASQLSVERLAIFGKNQNVLKLQVSDGKGALLDAICFREIDRMMEMFVEKFGQGEVDKAKKGIANALTCSLVYTPKVNDYGGEHVQLEVKYYM